MPAEWEPHAATWLSWPHDELTFPDRVPQAEDAYRHILRALTPNERVNLLVKDEETHDSVLKWLASERIANVTLWDMPTADVWFRDYGPIFVTRNAPDGSGRQELAMTKWEFNAWGDKYETLLADNKIPHKLHPHLGMPMFETGIVMEGGSLDVNGHGTLLTTEQCLLNPNRNPDLTRGDIEKKLSDHLGIDHFIWLKDGIEGDDTDGHVDDITRFVGPTTVVTAVEADTASPNHEPLANNLALLRKATDQDGTPLTVIELPMPEPLIDAEGMLPASYANFYIANRVVLMPSFGGARDAQARDILAKCFPSRTVVPIPCQDLVYGMGTLHCISQQQPLARKLP